MPVAKCYLLYGDAKSDQAEDKAKALFQDLQLMKESIKTQYNYNKIEDNDLELSSFIQEIEPELLKVFFPEWCEYFSGYHQVEEYCRL